MAQLAAVAMVRNEADVIEAFVRHHASRVDALYVVDHRSEDGTRDILAALLAEGLHIRVAHDDQPAQRQSETVTALARRAFADAPAAVVGPGSHAVLLAGADQDLTRQPVRLARVPPALACLAHLPVRSASQLCTKIAPGWRAHQAAAPRDATLAYHWQALYVELARTGSPQDRRLREIASNYGVPAAAWRAADAIALVDDPLPADTPIRHAALARPVAVRF